MNRYICIHGHFYQPPRENAWLEEVETQKSAYPYHDWNCRITDECYARNSASRILDKEKNIIDIVDNYSRISFNFGPTLLSWMERHAPKVYHAILSADKKGSEVFSGHGPAIAQTYNHMIMPLASPRDKKTQVLWGIKDFESRFGRRPEGMWLSETAVDLETLDMLSENGITFTILAPGQAKRVRKIGDKRWKSVGGAKVDIKMPYTCSLPSGRSIAIFFYDGPISQDVAFGGLLSDGAAFGKRLAGMFNQEADEAQLVHIATDGETYGHHHRFGDMGLAYCLYHIESTNLAKLTIYGEYLEKHPPSFEVEVYENSSWSCAHGVERWRSNCGCTTGGENGWTQEWRIPLRGAMDWLRDNLIHIYEEQMQSYTDSPWQVRDEYIDLILNRSLEHVNAFLQKHISKTLDAKDKTKILKLLEMQRNAMLMYTSCGWFFNEISGIETIQIMQYAARAMQLAGEVSGVALEEPYQRLLERARSNIKHMENGANIYEKFVKPVSIDLIRVGAHYGITSLFNDYSDDDRIYMYTVKKKAYESFQAGNRKLAIGKVTIISDVTMEENCISFAVIYFGDHTLIAGANSCLRDEDYSAMLAEASEKFSKGEVTEVIKSIEKYFDKHVYSVWHLFKDAQIKVLDDVFQKTLEEMLTAFRGIYQRHYPSIQAVQSQGIKLPEYFQSVLEFLFTMDIRRQLENDDDFNLDNLKILIENARRSSVSLDKKALAVIAGAKIVRMMDAWSERPENIELLQGVVMYLETLELLEMDINLWKTQNSYFFIGKKMLPVMREKEAAGDDAAKTWLGYFVKLSDFLGVRV